MAEQDEQKEQGDSGARKGKPVASVPPRASAARAAVKTVTPEAPPEIHEEGGQADRQLIRRRQLVIGGLGVAATAVCLGGWLLADRKSVV